jgi:Tol biopolymer transport system component
LAVSGNSGPEDKPTVWAVSFIQGTFQKLQDGGRCAAVSPDGQLIALLKDGSADVRAGSGNEIWLTDANGGNPRVLSRSGERGQFHAVTGLKWSGDGRRIAYVLRRRVPPEFVLESMGLDGGTAEIVFDSRLRSFAWEPDNRIIYELLESSDTRDSSLWELALDTGSGRVTGSPHLVTRFAGFAIRDLQITMDGRRMALLKRSDQSDVYVGELEGDPVQLKRPRRVTQDDRVDWPGRWTLDSGSILFFSNRTGNLDIFKQRLGEEAPQRIMASAEDKRMPQMSPDGAWILYLAWNKPDGHSSPQYGHIMRLPVAGGPPEVVLEAKGYPGSAQIEREGFLLTVRGHPDFHCPVLAGSPCVLSELDRQQLVFSAFDPLEGRKREVARVDFDRHESLFWDLSPDGKRIAFGQTEVHRGLLHILPLDGGSAMDVTAKGWANFSSVGWSADGRQLFVSKGSSSGDSLLRVSLNGDAEVLHKAGMWIEHPVASPDGRQLAWGEVSSNSNAWIIENFR